MDISSCEFPSLLDLVYAAGSQCVYGLYVFIFDVVCEVLYRVGNCQSKNSSGRSFSTSLPMFTFSFFGFFGCTTT